MKVYSKICDGVNKVISVLLFIVFTAMTLVAVTEVVRRYIWGLSFVWSDEFLRYMLVWMAFLGGPVALRRSKLAKFDLGHNKLSERTRDILAIVVIVVEIVLFAFILVYSYRWATSFSAQKSRMNSINMTMQPVYFSVPVGMVFCELFSIEHLLQKVVKMKGAEK